MPQTPSNPLAELALVFSWWKIAFTAIGAGLGGNFGVKIMDYAFHEFQRSRDRRASAREIVEKHLDPILKAGEDLVGEIRSLARHDFVEFQNLDREGFEPLTNMDVSNLLFLFGHFWARIQILRREATYASIGRTSTGSSLKSFLDTLESRNVRILARPYQRGIGESLIQSQAAQLSSMNYYQFVSDFSHLGGWFQPLANVIRESANPKGASKPPSSRPIYGPVVPSRQLLLRYGAVVHAMLDTLDADHALVPDLPGWSNKLTKQTRKSLALQVFPVRLPVVKNVEKYCS
jgi:hypothetical protein